YPDAARAFDETRRVLRRGGCLIVSSVNPSWSDMNPSPFSTRYLDADAFRTLLGGRFKRVELFGAFPAASIGARAQMLSGLKRMAIATGVMPRTMKGKALLKRLVYGPLERVPAEIEPPEDVVPPVSLPTGASGSGFKVIYAIAHA